MRRTAITRLVKAKVDLPTIQRISRHKTIAALLRYVNVYGPHIDDAIQNISIGVPASITRELHTLPERRALTPASGCDLSKQSERVSVGADGGTRTRTPIREKDFKSSASTGFATSAQAAA
jgi:hypothetical protein